MHRCAMSMDDAEFVLKFVVEECYSHEEFFHMLRDMGVEDVKERRLDRAS